MIQVSIVETFQARPNQNELLLKMPPQPFECCRIETPQISMKPWVLKTISLRVFEMDSREAKTLNAHMKSITEHLDHLVREFRAFSSNVKREDSSEYRVLQTDVSVEVDVVSPNIKGRLHVLSSENEIVFNIVFNDEMAQKMKDVLNSDPLEGLLISSVVPE